jgi:4-diphosphocytidyl-2-C-methyl-D-erythritol kinase
LVTALAGGDLADIAAHLHNDLYGPALRIRPEIEGGLRALLDAGAVGAGMSGSGPTVFGIAGGEREALDIARSVDEVFSRVEVRASAPTGVTRM